MIIFTLFLGSAVAMIWRLGGSRTVRNWAIDRIDTRRKAGIAAWVFGVALFFDDYANTAIVGSTMNDVSDYLNISREKLSYLVGSTAAPVATLDLSSWVAFQLSMIESGYAATVILVVAALMLVWGYTRVTPLALLPFGVVLLAGLVYPLSELDASRRGISPPSQGETPDVTAAGG